ncbi:MAG TPA: hypothetical protein VFA26_20900 [Gemmataceae bacterium]|nr:hypothetical protein [Gemmataceae bacterium]
MDRRRGRPVGSFLTVAVADPGQGLFGLPDHFGPGGFVAQPGFGPRQPAPVTTVGPLWFRKMDRNGDDDLSPAEWLGRPEDFQRIDLDGDGLISPEEAEKAGAAPEGEGQGLRRHKKRPRRCSPAPGARPIVPAPLTSRCPGSGCRRW